MLSANDGLNPGNDRNQMLPDSTFFERNSTCFWVFRYSDSVSRFHAHHESTAIAAIDEVIVIASVDLRTPSATLVHTSTLPATAIKTEFTAHPRQILRRLRP